MNVVFFKLSHNILVSKVEEMKKKLTNNHKNTKQNKPKNRGKRRCYWRTDWPNEALFNLCYVYFKEPGQSACYHGRKTRVFCVLYHVVLTVLTVTSIALSSYAVLKSGNGATDGSPQKPHPVDGNTNYRMWSLVGMSNDGLMVLNPSGSNFCCNGSFSGSGSKFPIFLNWFFPFYEASWK